MNRKGIVVLSAALVAVACGKKNTANAEHATLCRSYCGFVGFERSEASNAAKSALLAADFETPPDANTKSDEQMKVFGDQARHHCFDVHEALARQRTAERAIARAEQIVRVERPMENVPSASLDDVHIPDCLTASPAQMRSFASTLKANKPEPAITDDQCQSACESNLNAKLASP